MTEVSSREGKEEFLCAAGEQSREGRGKKDRDGQMEKDGLEHGGGRGNLREA